MTMYEELVKRLREVIPWECPLTCKNTMHEAADAIGELLDRIAASEVTIKRQSDIIQAKDRDLQRAIDAKPKWVSVAERLPECEQEVMICTEKKLVGKDAYIDSIVTPAIYEDGTMPECDSIWHWEDIDYAGWDEENDCGIIPEGWWENRHFNPDEVYNNPVDRKVVAWMPLPDPYKPKEET